jgi:Leucine-rich repeat (LRR) protein
MKNLNFLLFSLIIVSTTTLLKFSESKTHWEDIKALKQFKQNINPDSVKPGSCINTWNFTFDPCDNLFSDKFTCGLRCDITVSKRSRLTELTLDQAGYTGSLSSINLPYLEILEISNNYFTGSIPDSLSNLTRLSRLSLSFNSFTGEIPSSIGSSLSNLQELYLNNNNLQGTIPSSFNNLKSLTRLELQQNNLTGKFPDLGSLQNLYYIDLSDNKFSGDPFEFPVTLPVSLVQISMRNNNLTGLTSESFKNLNYLQVVDFSSNKINGYVPSIFFQLPSLQQLTLSFNEFSSIETPSFGTESLQNELIAVDLSNNQLQGFLPSFLAFLPKLSSLSLENNRFTGLIPVQFALKTVFPETGIAPFGRLLLGGNYLIGGIPRPLLVLKQDSANVSLVDNCLFRCPHVFFFCQGGTQKSSSECSSVIIP